MHINPAQVSIGEMLSNRGTFEVPKYQRNYAWDESQIASFLKDLDLCRGARLADADKPRHHFFGGIVTTSLGYDIAEGPEIELEYNNFAALNFSDDHPAKAETDTLWIAPGVTRLRT